MHLTKEGRTAAGSSRALWKRGTAGRAKEAIKSWRARLTGPAATMGKLAPVIQECAGAVEPAQAANEATKSY
jgi:hypothetical protein